LYFYKNKQTHQPDLDYQNPAVGIVWGPYRQAP